MLTEYGKRLLEHGADSPHDATRYIAALKKRVPNPDAVALSYLCEAIGAWQAGLYRASVVMLGVACERLALLLAEHVRDHDIEPYSKKIRELTKGNRPASITDIYSVVREAFDAAAQERRLPGDLARSIIDRDLSAVFEYVRRLRNESGHPTGESVSAEQAEAGLLLFPGFHGLVNRLMTELKPKGGA